MADKTTLGARPVKVRHVKRSQSGTTVLGTVYAGDWDGLAGRGGFVSGTFERRLYEEGTGTLRLANAAGSDGQRHIDRLRCLSDAGYLPGDEWLEVYEDGDLVAVWTPTGRQSKRRSDLQIAGEDATTLLKRTREGTVGYWNHAPRDAIEYYGRVWKVFAANEFDTPGQFTYGTTSTASADLQWQATYGETDANYPGAIRMNVHAFSTTVDGQVEYTGGTGARLGLQMGPGSPDPNLPWRLEAEVVPESMSYGDSFFISDQGVALGINFPALIAGRPPYISARSIDDSLTYNYLPFNLPFSLELGTPVNLAIEFRSPWAYFFVNGRNVGVLGTKRTAAYTLGRIYCGFYCEFANATTAFQVRRLMLRHAPRLLVDDGAGDLALPGSPAPGGLYGQYFDCTDKFAQVPFGGAQYVMLEPTLTPAASRVDARVNFAATNPPTWQPAAVAGAGTWSARWTGSIYLDLSNVDVALRVTADDEARLWVGRTRVNEEVAIASTSTAASTWLKAGSSSGSAPSGATGQLAGQASGWYPVVIEYKQAGGNGGCVFEMETSTAVGTWTAVPSKSLSPYGCYNDLVRNESHYDALKNIADTFGYQWTCAPGSLESGAFPGRIVPRARVGRDTEMVLDEPEATDIQADIDLDSRADALQADASGLADQTGVAQLAAEMFNLPAAAQHLILGEDYESLSDISQQALLVQRLGTILSLRSAAWEEIAARPAGRRELLDSWPLTGSLAEFSWAPGDGLRLNFPTVDVVDTLPRQILGLSREFVPDGMKPPAASFRPRPRSVRSLLRTIRRDALLPQRNYQQQLVVVTGSLGGHGASTGGVDDYSRIALPLDLDRIVRVEFVVLQKSDASGWLLELNLVNLPSVTITARGRIDVTGRVLTSPGGFNVARLATTGGTSTGSWIVQLVATVRV